MPHRQVKPQLRRNAKRLRSDQTDAEELLWSELRANRLMGLKFRRQYPIANYIVDFACPAHKLIIELDGGGHGEDGQTAYDTTRTKYLESRGWTVVRFWNHEVTRNIDAACDHILGCLTQKGVTFS